MYQGAAIGKTSSKRAEVIGTLVSYLASMYQGAAIFWADVSHRHSLWLPMGKTSGITKSLCIYQPDTMDSYSTPHRDSVSSVIFGIDVSGGCYILGGCLSQTFTMATYGKN